MNVRNNVSAISMRTTEEIYQDVQEAFRAVDVSAMAKLSIELKEQADEQAHALAAIVDGVHDQAFGEHVAALSYFERAYELYARLGNAPGMASAGSNTASSYEALGDYEAAISWFTRAKDGFEKSGHRIQGAKTVLRIGCLHMRRGEMDAAKECFQRAHHEFRGASSDDGVAEVEHALGNFYNHTGDRRKAIEHYNAALQWYLHSKNIVRSAVVHDCIGTAHLMLGDYAQAMESHLRALQVFGERGLNSKAARSCNHIGLVHRRIHCTSEAISWLTRALDLHEKASEVQDAAVVIGNLGCAFYEQGDYSRAVEHHRRALRAFEVTGAMPRCQIQRVCIVKCLLALMTYEEAAGVHAEDSPDTIIDPDVRAQWYLNNVELLLVEAKLKEASENAMHAMNIAAEAVLPEKIVMSH